MIPPKKYCDEDGQILAGVRVRHKGKEYYTGNRRHLYVELWTVPKNGATCFFRTIHQNHLGKVLGSKY